MEGEEKKAKQSEGKHALVCLLSLRDPENHVKQLSETHSLHLCLPPLQPREAIIVTHAHTIACFI